MTAALRLLLILEWIAATPARSISRTVRAMLNALPNPVSTSTSSGSSVAAVMRRASSSTSPSVVTPRSGRPNDAFATPAPDR